MRPKSDKASEPKKRRSSTDKSENKRKPSSDRRKSADAKPERKSRFSSVDSDKKKTYASDKRKFSDASADKPARFSKDSEKRDSASSVRSKRFSSDESDRKKSFISDKRKSSERDSDKPKRFSRDSEKSYGDAPVKRKFSSDDSENKKPYNSDKRKFADKNNDKPSRFSKDSDKKEGELTDRKRFSSDNSDRKGSFSLDKKSFSDKPKRFSNDSDKKENGSTDRKKVWTDKRDLWNDDKEKPRRFTAGSDKQADEPKGKKRFSSDDSEKPRNTPFEKRSNNDNFIKKERKESSETPFDGGNERPKRRSDSGKPFEKKAYEKTPNKGNARRIVIEKNPFASEREYPERKSIYSSDPKDDESHHTFKERAGIRPRSESTLDRKPHKKEVASTFSEEGIRLNRYIAQAGICSRREADVMITSGAITVNGVIVTELGIKVKSTDKIQVGGETLKSEKFQYVLLNKPKDYITTVDDPQKRNTVMDLVRDACRERIYPVGRLDRNTTGLLMLTNDGELAKKLTHPRYRVKKIYHAELDKSLTQVDFDKIAQGFELEDGRVEVDEVAYISPTSKKEVGVEIHIGRNRIVRRMFEQLGYNVVKLDRVVFAGLTKKNLPRGRWRFLTEEELNRLKMNVFSR
ncbi:MAG: pseudouridine synthase [Bacteroidota bacterium]